MHRAYQILAFILGQGHDKSVYTHLYIVIKRADIYTQRLYYFKGGDIIPANRCTSI